MEEKCYCCKNHPPSRYSNFYGVPICTACHGGIVLMTWDNDRSKEMIDKYREKMFANADRIKAALHRLGHEWNDPREDKETPDQIFVDLAKNGHTENLEELADRMFPPYKPVSNQER